MKLRTLVLAIALGLLGASIAFATPPKGPKPAPPAHPANVVAPVHPAKPAHPAPPAPKHHKFGPYTINTTDNGSCAPPPGAEWANLTLQRTYKVHANHDGSFKLRSENKGTFVTLAARSPGACETTDSHHGATIQAGFTGKVHGFLEGTVTGGTYNPNATCPTECTTSAFLLAFFGPSAQFTCNNGFAGCRFSFKYSANKHQHGLLFRHWTDEGLNGTSETFKGDIASG
jgi:hypothetical protein